MTKSKKDKEKEVSEERGFEISNSSFFKKILNRAAGFLGTPGKIYKLLSQAYKKSDAIDGNASIGKRLKTQIFALFSLVKDFVKGDYREFEFKKIILMVAGIIYLVSPLDLVPDFIPLIGLMDDISVLAWIISTLSEEIDEYLLWKNNIIGVAKKKKVAPTIIDITEE